MSRKLKLIERFGAKKGWLMFMRYNKRIGQIRRYLLKKSKGCHYCGLPDPLDISLKGGAKEWFNLKSCDFVAVCQYCAVHKDFENSLDCIEVRRIFC